jgi:transposase
MFGGKRFAHLHYRGEVYMLNREQWQAFANKIKNDLVKRLQSSSAISVEQIQDLSDAVDPIA